MSINQKLEKIKTRLKWIITPTLSSDFKKQIVENLNDLCKNIVFEWDELPTSEYVILDKDIRYNREYHVDTLICDESKYEIEAEYEIYEIERYFIVHSFKLVEIKEKHDDKA